MGVAEGHGAADELFLRVLGPLEVSGPGGPVDVGPPQRRVLLLRLLVEAGRPVGLEQLREDLWEGRAPASAVSSIHAHVSRLRSILNPRRAQGRASRVLESTSAGYTLSVPPEWRDTVVFECAAEQGFQLAREERWAQALRAAEDALGLWRGQPYAEAMGLSFVRDESDRLFELYWSVQELRARMLLEEGQPLRAVAAAEGLVSRDALRETSWVVLLRSLYAAGRGAEALRRYEAVRRILAEALGTDPGPELRRTYLAILRHDLGVEMPPVGPRTIVLAGGLRGTSAEPREDGDGAKELPLTGRDAELARLLQLLPRARSGRTGWAVVSGQAGSGKSRLVQELAERARKDGFAVVQDRYPKRVRPGTGTSYGSQALRVLQALRYGAAQPADGRPTLCLIENVQGIPAPVINALADCAETVHDARVAVVCTMPAVPDPVTDELRAALALGGAAHLELRSLDIGDIEELLRGRRPATGAAVDTDETDESVDDAISADAADLHALTGGNPYFLTEMLRLPRARWSDPGRRLPPGLDSVIRVRLSALDAGSRRVLETAAVIGDRIDVALLARACAVPSNEVLRALDAALDADIVVRTPDTAPAVRADCSFSCGLIRSALLAANTPSRQHGLRAAVERALAGQKRAYAPDFERLRMRRIS